MFFYVAQNENLAGSDKNVEFPHIPPLKKTHTLTTMSKCAIFAMGFYGERIILCLLSDLTEIPFSTTVDSRYLELGYLEFCQTRTKRLSELITHFDCFLQP